LVRPNILARDFATMTPQSVPRRKRRPARLRARPLPLTVKQILAWADAHHQRRGVWPSKTTGRITDALSETWCAINLALMRGGRGLPGGVTLARLLLEKRGVRHLHYLPTLTKEQILVWIDDHHQRTGEWPTLNSGKIPEAPGEIWRKIHAALFQGMRGLPPGGSLPRLLAEARGVRNPKGLPPLSRKQILSWADAFFQEHARWPNRQDSSVPEMGAESWGSVNSALIHGGRGLAGGSSLALFLQRERGARNKKNLPPLTLKQIAAWARRCHDRTGRWPTEDSGPIEGSAGEVWGNVNQALRNGNRGLPGGDTLPRLLERVFGVRNEANLPSLRITDILQWADQHKRRTGGWPKTSSGAVAEAPGETWSAIDAALFAGMRGLPARLSLVRLLAKYRGVRSKREPPLLTSKQILRWADQHYQRVGRWPGAGAGAIPGAAGETWSAVAQALRIGRRGLPGGDSLRRLLERHGRLASPVS
jgi:hypothetical protein